MMDVGLKSCLSAIAKTGQHAQASLSTLALRSAHFLLGLIQCDRATVPVMVASELSHCPGWCDIDPLHLSVKTSHGHGGGKTFKVSAPSEVCASPPAVAVHICCQHEPRASAISRATDASAVFAAAGLAPTCLAQGRNFYIEAWEGYGQASLKTLEDFQNLGSILAQIHALPTGWFDKHRKQLISQLPALGQAPYGSHVWTLIHPGVVDHFKSITEEVMQAFVGEPLVAPMHPIASRIVTCHIDLHTGNLLNADKGFMCIDFESACVTFAASDLALAMALSKHAGEKACLSPIEVKRAVVRSYLQELDESFDPVDVEDLIFEAELARACYLHSELNPSALRFSPKTAIALIEAMQSFLSRARNSSPLRASIIELGFRHVAEDDAPLKLAWETHREAQHRNIARECGLPCPSVSTDAGTSVDSDKDSDDSYSVWGLPLGCQEVALPLGFRDSGLNNRDLAFHKEYSA